MLALRAVGWAARGGLHARDRRAARGHRPVLPGTGHGNPGRGEGARHRAAAGRALRARADAHRRAGRHPGRVALDRPRDGHRRAGAHRRRDPGHDRPGLQRLPHGAGDGADRALQRGGPYRDHRVRRGPRPGGAGPQRARSQRTGRARAGRARPCHRRRRSHPHRRRRERRDHGRRGHLLPARHRAPRHLHRQGHLPRLRRPHGRRRARARARTHRGEVQLLRRDLPNPKGPRRRDPATSRDPGACHRRSR